MRQYWYKRGHCGKPKGEASTEASKTGEWWSESKISTIVDAATSAEASGRSDIGSSNSSDGSHNVADNNASTTTHSEHKAMVPSWRLAEEAEKRRLLQAKLAEVKAELAELRAVMKAARLHEIERLKPVSVTSQLPKAG